MTLTPTTLERVRHAAGLAAILDAAYEAFEDMLQILRAHEDPASGLFLPVMMAAASAADGRDAIMFAPSLPPWQGSGPRGGRGAGGGGRRYRGGQYRVRRGCGRRAGPPAGRSSCPVRRVGGRSRRPVSVLRRRPVC